MSLLSRDQIRIAVSPQQVSLLRIRRGWTTRITDKKEIACAANSLDWRSALNTLQQALPGFVHRGDQIVVILSNHFIRYELIPLNQQFLSSQEETALVQHRFQQVYGLAAEKWSYRLSYDRQHHNCIACAIDQELLDSLQQTMQQHHLTLRSVQPYLMTAFNQCRSQLGDSGWFALVESGRLSLARIHKQQWCSLRSIKTDGDWINDLSLLLNRETILAATASLENAELPIYVYAPGYPETVALSQNSKTIHITPVGATDVASHAPFAIAMAG